MGPPDISAEVFDPAAVAVFDNSYARLPARFFAAQKPAVVAAPGLIKFNAALAAELGLDAAAVGAMGPADLFAGKSLAVGMEPVAMAYAGHQFGNFVPQLGDGRAILLGEVVDRAGIRRDIQLKGAGRTAFSRGGDGRAALGPVLREYLISEAMYGLGIPATRALAAVTTGEDVLREAGLLPGAILTRVAASHIRVGTFQYFAARGDAEALKILADYVIARLYPALAGHETPYLALLEAVAERQARLIAQWMLVGFIHGVMNTDNMAVSGETIDFGPCAFMDVYDPGTVFSAIDQMGRYAYGNQPAIAQWNLARFAETLLPLLGEDEARSVELATAVVVGFMDKFEAFWMAGMRAKLGLQTVQAGDGQLVKDLLKLLQVNAVDFTLFFRRLSVVGHAGVADLFKNPADFAGWDAQWQARLASEGLAAEERTAAMRRVNPAFMPRNHLVEQALAAAGQGDFKPFHALMAVLERPYEEQPEMAHYAALPLPSEQVFRTYCGT